MIKQWLEDFKLALILENVDRLESLLDHADLKNFLKELAKNSVFENFLKENVNILNQIKALLQEAILLINQKKTLKTVEIQKFQKVLKYIKS